jgi:hypothetical protein
MAEQDKILSTGELERVVAETVATTPITDIHTHIYDARFGDLLLWGVDELVTYHYLIAEVMRAEFGRTTPEEYYQMSKSAQANLIWQRLFIDNSPISEACRGPLTVLGALGLDVAGRDLDEMRAYFAGKTAEEYIDKVFELVNVKEVVMTNDPFDEQEAAVWKRGGTGDTRFKAALRLDGLIVRWEETAPLLAEQGYDVAADLSGNSYDEIMRFLAHWRDVMNPVYMAVSLSEDFSFPAADSQAKVIENAILPFAAKEDLPFAMMIGVKRLINPALKLAGDGVGKADIKAVEYMCANYADVKFLVTMLSRENQHELCVAARKFPNLMPFGCWWFLNDPSLIDEMTRMRIELLGLSFVPQHSDARILDQLIYKWSHFRNILSKILTEKYSDTMRSGWVPTREEIQRDVSGLFSNNFWEFVG